MTINKIWHHNSKSYILLVHNGKKIKLEATEGKIFYSGIGKEIKQENMDTIIIESINFLLTLDLYGKRKHDVYGGGTREGILTLTAWKNIKTIEHFLRDVKLTGTKKFKELRLKYDWKALTNF